MDLDCICQIDLLQIPPYPSVSLSNSSSFPQLVSSTLQAENRLALANLSIDKKIQVPECHFVRIY